jgi:hypothetical protein
MAEFTRSNHEARTFEESETAVEKGLSNAGLMLFMQLDHGAILRKETGGETPKMVRFIIGNRLIMKGNGQACSRCRFLRAGHGPGGWVHGRGAFVI